MGVRKLAAEPLSHRTKADADVANVGVAKSGKIPTLTKRRKFVLAAKAGAATPSEKNKRKKIESFSRNKTFGSRTKF